MQLASAVSHYEIANAYHLSTIEFKGAAITNSLNAVFVIGSFIESTSSGQDQPFYRHSGKTQKSTRIPSKISHPRYCLWSKLRL